MLDQLRIRVSLLHRKKSHRLSGDLRQIGIMLSQFIPGPLDVGPVRQEQEESSAILQTAMCFGNRADDQSGPIGAAMVATFMPAERPQSPPSGYGTAGGWRRSATKARTLSRLDFCCWPVRKSV